MSARPGVTTTVRIPADGGKSPNAYFPEITAEVRCHWPPNARLWDIREAIRRAARFAQAEAEAEINRRAARGRARDARAGQSVADGAGLAGTAAGEAREAHS